MRIFSNLTLYLGIFLIPFYIFPSGLPQPSYILLLLFVCIWIIFQKGILDGEVRDFLNSFYPFFTYSLIVNIMYTFLYEDITFLGFPIFFLFNLIVSSGLISFMNYNNNRCNKYKNGNSRVEKLIIVLILTLVLLLLLWLLGFGRYDVYPRYNSFFNDPNQMAFFVICSLSIVLAFVKKIWIYLPVMMLGIFLVLLTISRSALIGVVPLVLSTFFIYSNKCNNPTKESLLIRGSGILFLGVALLLGAQFLLDIEYINRLTDRFIETDFSEQSDIRGYGRLIEYTEYLLFGAGQGLDIRFNTNVEIHSTWAAFLFYYGIIGLLGFIIPLLKIFKFLNMNHKLLFMAPMLYSFSTFGARTPVFWIFLSVFYYLSRHENKH